MTFFLKFVGALKALLVLGAIYVLTVFVSELRGLFWANHWTYGGIKIGFFGLIIAGFALGYCFPTTIQKYVSSTTSVLSAIVVTGGCFLSLVATHISVPDEKVLANCTNGIVNINLSVPKGHRFDLLLNAPGAVQMSNGFLVSSYKFIGRIRIKSGNSLIADAPLSSDNMTMSSSVFILTGFIPSWNQLIRPQKEYGLEVEFNPPPPTNSTLSLHWMENAADKGE